MLSLKLKPPMQILARGPPIRRDGLGETVMVKILYFLGANGGGIGMTEEEGKGGGIPHGITTSSSWQPYLVSSVAHLHLPEGICKRMISTQSIEK